MSNLPVKSTSWKEGDGIWKIKMEDMQTPHLFFTARMIFNHIAYLSDGKIPFVIGDKEDLKIQPYMLDEIQKDLSMYVETISVAIKEVERRKDLNSKYLERQKNSIKNIIRLNVLVMNINKEMKNANT